MTDAGTFWMWIAAAGWCLLLVIVFFSMRP